MRPNSRHLSKMTLSDEFWRYACALYASQGVKSRCLALQDEHQLNVNLVLLCLFMDSRARCLPSSWFGQALAAIKPLDGKLQELRRTRRALKARDPDGYSKALARELRLERQQQQVLVDSLPADMRPACGQNSNLTAYWQQVHHHPLAAPAAWLISRARGCVED